MSSGKHIKLFSDHSFFVSSLEVQMMMKSGNFPTVTSVIKFLFPDYIFYKVARRSWGYWGKVPYPRKINR